MEQMASASPTSVAFPRGGQQTRGVLDTIGTTPLVRLTGYLEVSDVALHLKLESANPGGSAKDRPALQMIEEARADGRLHVGSVVVESTSGNTGIGLAQVCRYYGLPCILVVDGRTQAANLAAMRALGAQIEVVAPSDPDVDPARGPPGPGGGTRREPAGRLLAEPVREPGQRTRPRARNDG
jgi:threonine dehydratase